MIKQVALASMVALGLGLASAAQAATATGVVNFVQTNSTGATFFRLSTTGAFLYTVINPVQEPGFYLVNQEIYGFNALTNRVNTAYIKGNSTQITYNSCQAGFASCVSNIQ